jgi:hypothetical protein
MYNVDLAEACWGEEKIGLRRIRSLIARLDGSSAFWRDIEAQLASLPTAGVALPSPQLATPAEMKAFVGKTAIRSRR